MKEKPELQLKESGERMNTASLNLHQTMKEEWRDVRGYEGLYQVSNLGNVKSLVGWNGHKYIQRELILKPSLTTTGYYKVSLKKLKDRKEMRVHRLVAEAFIQNIESKPYINHIDGNPLNNVVDNLEWCTQAENVRHAVRIGLRNVMQLNEECICDMYINGMMSQRKIANHFNVSTTTIGKIIKSNGIDSRGSGEYQNLYNIHLDELISELKEGKTNKELSQKYKCPSNLIAVRRYQFRKRGII